MKKDKTPSNNDETQDAAKPRRIPPRAALAELRDRLREMDNATDFTEEFFGGLHDRIMARIDKTEIQPASGENEKRRRADKRVSVKLSLVPLRGL